MHEIDINKFFYKFDKTKNSDITEFINIFSREKTISNILQILGMINKKARYLFYNKLNLQRFCLRQFEIIANNVLLTNEGNLQCLFFLNLPTYVIMIESILRVLSHDAPYDVSFIEINVRNLCTIVDHIVERDYLEKLEYNKFNSQIITDNLELFIYSLCSMNRLDLVSVLYFKVFRKSEYKDRFRKACYFSLTWNYIKTKFRRKR